jgi:metal transporter CNNM
MDEVLNWIFVIIFVGLSAVFSGLNIALMSLSLPELKRHVKLGSRRAIKVYPLRKNAHLSLASILLGNVGAISATSLFLGDKLSNGLVAGLLSTLLIVVFGELIPQALFSKRALTICAWLAPFIRLVVVITYPIAKPLQLMLDALLGSHSEKQLHSRSELGLIINEHADSDASELDDDEVEIIRSTLLLSEKKVEDIMTDIRHVYWLEPDTIVDGEKIQELKTAGWSRIPVFNSKHTKFYGSLHMKDLVDINFRKEPREVRELKLHKAEPIGSKTALDTSFRRFISARTHLLPVEKNDEITGIVTIEDLLEEIIGHEIIDETDHKHHRGLE